jgi:rhodanese-related sulfurtransferase
VSRTLVLAAVAAVAVALALVRARSRHAGEPAAALAWPAVHRLVESRYPDVRPITTAELAAWLADPTRPPPLLLDVRTADEYAISHLPGAMRVEPGAAPDATLAGVPRDRPIVTYCSVGLRSARMAELLGRRGWTDVRNLRGSIFAWANEGRPVVRDGRPVRVVHPYDAVWGTLLAPALHPGAAAAGEEPPTPTPP